MSVNEILGKIAAPVTGIAIGLAAQTAFGATLDLTAAGTIAPNFGSPESFAGAEWETGDGDLVTGTGVLNPFLRLQANGTSTEETGYNTDRKNSDFQFDEKASDFTRSILFSSLVAVDGFYVFTLDLQEATGTPGDQYLSLTEFKLFTAGDSDLDGATYDAGLVDNWDGTDDVVLHYNLDAGGDNEVNLDYDVVGSGQGRPDLNIYIPTALFAGAKEYLVLYTTLGCVSTKVKGETTCDIPSLFTADSAFEEFATLQGDSFVPAPVPLPAAGFLLVGALGALGAMRRRKG